MVSIHVFFFFLLLGLGTKDGPRQSGGKKQLKNPEITSGSLLVKPTLKLQEALTPPLLLNIIKEMCYYN